jgi:hypothetical protein
MLEFLSHLFGKKKAPPAVNVFDQPRPPAPVYANLLVRELAVAFDEWRRGVTYYKASVWHDGLLDALNGRLSDSDMCPDCQHTHDGLVATVYGLLTQIETWWAYGHAPTHEDLINLRKGDFSEVKEVCPRCAGYGRIIASLEHKLQNIKREVTQLNEALRSKNQALDAQHYVWCNGGCTSGTHRYSENKITEEIVQEAERQVKRLRVWWENHKFRNKDK